MEVYQYSSYEEYLQEQRSANLLKKDRVWAREKYIRRIANWLSPRSPLRGICHGVRTGIEVDWFTRYLPSCDILGTEVGIATHPKVLKWDFNDENPDWMGRFDFVYSNSFDHSFNPHRTMRVWLSQLKPSSGVLILEYDRKQEHSKGPTAMDPVSMSMEEIGGLLWGLTGVLPNVVKLSRDGAKRWRGMLTLDLKKDRES